MFKTFKKYNIQNQLNGFNAMGYPCFEK